ncbi:MAG: ACP S-malonyltransferase [Syntrophomonadaceae bacterium]|nr:ACP S-malonyltransferase [Syntrophomonadaceae bacterium]
MPRLAFVFPGQGAQYPGMGKDFADNFTEAAHIFKVADDLAGYKLSSICFEGPKEKLNQTEFAQPALLVTSLAMMEVLKKQGIVPLMMAGLSLGEYTALVAAQALTLEEALPLVQTRARLMQEAVPAGKGAMAAVLGAEEEVVKQACKQAEGIVEIANYNCPGQVVISGETNAVKQAGDILKNAGVRVKMLAVSVPSHSPLMEEAATKLKPYLEHTEWQESLVDVVSNVNARENSAAAFSDVLARQLFCPVLWEQSIRYMMDKVDYFVEVGPGTTLSGLIRRIDRNRILGNVNDIESMQKVIKEVKSR